jgi:hypothetical protein
MCVRWRVHATSNCDRQARSPGRQALPLRPSCARRPAARLPRRLPRDRLPAPACQGRSCTRASPRTRPSTPTPFEPVDEGTLVWLRKSPLVDRRARRALRVRRRAGPTSVRPSSWHRYGKEHPPVSKLILKMSMSLDGFVADANGDKAFIFSSMSEDAATAPKQYSSAGTASEPLAPSTTWSAGPDASYWRRTTSCCGPSSRKPEHRWPSEGSGCCSTTVNLTGTR